MHGSAVIGDLGRFPTATGIADTARIIRVAGFVTVPLGGKRERYESLLRNFAEKQAGSVVAIRTALTSDPRLDVRSQSDPILGAGGGQMAKAEIDPKRTFWRTQPLRLAYQGGIDLYRTSFGTKSRANSRTGVVAEIQMKDLHITAQLRLWSMSDRV